MKIQLKRSNVLDGGQAKEPTSAQMEYGELAVNYNDGDPAVFLKDSNDTVIRIAGKGAKGLDGDYVNITGDTMTGQLVLPGGGSATEAIQKQEVEALIAGSDTGTGKYVEIAGDNMTGDLTLGTDKITLDAGNGNITAAGRFNSGNVESGDGVRIYETGAVLVRKDAAGAAFRVADGDASVASNETVVINQDGSASFDGVCEAEYFKSVVTGTDSGLYLYKDGGSNANAINISPTNSGGDITTRLAYDGTATFAGNVDAYGYVSKGNSSNTIIWTGYHIDGVTNPITSTIKADGSATFAGASTFSKSLDVGIGDQGTAKLLRVRSLGSPNPGRTSFEVTASVAGVETAVAEIKGDGSATFAGNISVGNYAATSNTGEGVQVFNSGNIYLQNSGTGPTNYTPFRIYYGTEIKAQFTNQGDLTTDGTITAARADIGDNASGYSGTPLSVYSNSSASNIGTIQAKNFGTGGANFVGFNSAGSPTVTLLADGTITATGYSMASLAQL